MSGSNVVPLAKAREVAAASGKAPSFYDRTKDLLRTLPGDLDAGDRLMMIVLLLHAATDGTSIYASAATLAELMGLGRRATFERLRGLIARGFVLEDGYQQHARGVRTRRRRLNIPAIREAGERWKKTGRRDGEGPTRVQRGALTPVHHGAPTPVQRGAPKPSLLNYQREPNLYPSDTGAAQGQRNTLLADGIAQQKEDDPDQYEEPVAKQEDPAAAANRPPKARLDMTEDWRPSPTDREYIRAAGYDPAAAEWFRDECLARGTTVAKSWSPLLRMWINNGCTFNAP